LSKWQERSGGCNETLKDRRFGRARYGVAGTDVKRADESDAGVERDRVAIDRRPANATTSP
jgi:hypothetical protein